MPLLVLLLGLSAPALASPAPGAGAAGAQGTHFVSAESPQGESPASAPPPAPTAPGPSASPANGFEVAFAGLMLVAAIGAVAALWRRGALRRDALDVRRRDVGGAPWVYWLTGAAAMYFAQFYGALLGSTLAGPAVAGGSELRRMTLVNAPMYTAALVAAAIVLLVRPRAALGAGFRAGGHDVVIGLAAFLVAYPIVATVGNAGQLVAEVVAHFTGGAPPQRLAHVTLRELATGPRGLWWWCAVASVVVGAPVVEELLHRGFLQTTFVRAFGSPWLAVLLTSAIFTLSHLHSADVPALGGLFVLSVAMGVAFERTGRIAVPIVMHMAFNALNIAMALYT